MEYVDGGVMYSPKWYGYSIWFNTTEANKITSYSAFAGVAAGAYAVLRIMLAGAAVVGGAPVLVAGVLIGVGVAGLRAIIAKNDGQGFSLNYSSSNDFLGAW